MTATAREVRYTRPFLYRKQAEFLFTPARYSLVEASTKSGKTVGCLVWLFEQALLHGGPNKNYWWVAPTYTPAWMAFDRMRHMMPRWLYTTHETDRKITLINGAVIWFKGADRTDTLYGEDVYAAVIDEASRMKEGAWHAVRSTLTATQGPVRIIGNVKGRKNWFYTLARKAEAGAVNMYYARLTAYDAVEGGVLAAEEVEDARQNLPENAFAELYLAQPSDDGGNPFGLDHIRACLQPADAATGPPVAWGWDLAKSHDWTVGIALDHSGRVAQFERFQNPWNLTKPKIVAATGRVPALVDSTGAGDPVLEDLQRVTTGVFRGFLFSSSSKQKLMEGLAVAIQQRLVSFPEGPISQELETFEYEYTKTGVRYSAPSGLHDDCVIALGLVVEKVRKRFTASPRAPRSRSYITA